MNDRHDHADRPTLRPTPSRRTGRASKKMTIIAFTLMLLALIGYVLTNDESVEPGGGGEPVPAMAE
jgi:hypothetical protein